MIKNYKGKRVEVYQGKIIKVNYQQEIRFEKIGGGKYESFEDPSNIYKPCNLKIIVSEDNCTYYEITKDSRVLKRSGFMDNWTSIKEEAPPKDGKEFLSIDMNQMGVFMLVSWYKVHSYWVSKGEPISSSNITHWMLLPAKPEQ